MEARARRHHLTARAKFSRRAWSDAHSSRGRPGLSAKSDLLWFFWRSRTRVWPFPLFPKNMAAEGKVLEYPQTSTSMIVGKRVRRTIIYQPKLMTSTGPWRQSHMGAQIHLPGKFVMHSPKSENTCERNPQKITGPKSANQSPVGHCFASSGFCGVHSALATCTGGKREIVPKSARLEPCPKTLVLHLPTRRPQSSAELAEKSLLARIPFGVLATDRGPPINRQTLGTDGSMPQSLNSLQGVSSNINSDKVSDHSMQWENLIEFLRWEPAYVRAPWLPYSFQLKSAGVQRPCPKMYDPPATRGVRFW